MFSLQYFYIVAPVQQSRIIVIALLQTWILLGATRSYLFTEFQDEHAKPTEEDIRRCCTQLF